MAPPVAVVSGGSRGLGLAICRALASDGHRVAVLSRTLAGAAEAAAGLEGPAVRHIGRHTGLACDVRDSSSVDAAVSDIVAWAGPPQVVVNAAGVSHDALLARATDAQIEATMETNLLGSLRLCRAAARAMLRGRVQHGSCARLTPSRPPTPSPAAAPSLCAAPR